MRTLYWASTEEVGEVEGMFDQDGELLDFWACNDGVWRNEYFSGFMKRLGFNIEPAPDWMNEKLTVHAAKTYGMTLDKDGFYV